MLPFVAESPIPLLLPAAMLACPTAALCGIWLATVPLHLPPFQTLPLSLFPIDFVAVKLRREAALADGLAEEGEGKGTALNGIDNCNGPKAMISAV